MRALLIPVKDLRNAKQRLAPLWTQKERTELAEAMFDDFCGVIREMRGAARIFLVSSYAPAIDRAREYGWEILCEKSQESESVSVDAASRRCEALGVTSLLRLPIDLPFLEAGDVEWLLAQARTGPSMAIVPSRDGTGTNALLRTPPSLFPSHFGPNSFPKHLEEARRYGAECCILRHARLEMDIDDGSDLEVFWTMPRRDNATRRWLKQKTGSGFAVPAAR
jgi:2-phospho-L-lactate/phosphoenolpyruvate guanylyltransferase